MKSSYFSSTTSLTSLAFLETALTALFTFSLTYSTPSFVTLTISSLVSFPDLGANKIPTPAPTAAPATNFAAVAAFSLLIFLLTSLSL